MCSWKHHFLKASCLFMCGPNPANGSIILMFHYFSMFLAWRCLLKDRISLQRYLLRSFTYIRRRKNKNYCNNKEFMEYRNNIIRKWHLKLHTYTLLNNFILGSCFSLWKNWLIFQRQPRNRNYCFVEKDFEFEFQRLLMSLNNGKVFANQAYVVRTFKKLMTNFRFL